MGDVSIESHADDSVTLRVGTVTARISGDSWKEANDAAHLLGGLLSGRLTAKNLDRKMRNVMASLSDLDDALIGAERRVRELTQYASHQSSETHTTKSEDP